MFGALISYTKDKQHFVLNYEYQVVHMYVLTNDIIRFCVPYHREETHSKAIDSPKLRDAICNMTTTKGHLVLETAHLTIMIYDEFMIDIYDKKGNLICADYRGKRQPRFQVQDSLVELMKQEGHDVKLNGAGDYPLQIVKHLESGDCIYGLGDKTGPLNKRHYEYENWNSDIPFPHEDSFKALYKSIPFFLVLKENGCYGIFYDNNFRSYFNFGKENDEYYFFGSDEGNLDYYFINAGSMPELVERYTFLTGRTPLPQKWTLGYHQSRWGYDSEETFRTLAENFRKYRIPCDALHFDIDYMDGYRVFTWNKERFEDPGKLIEDLGKQGFHAVTIVDPGVKAEPGYQIYDEGVSHKYFVKDSKKKLYVNAVWPGDAVFPDFGKFKVQKWWGECLRFYIKLGVSGIWNDMNEPASFHGPLPDDLVFHDMDIPTTHKEMHNVYGHYMAKATYDGLKKYTKKRPFVITRACYSGTQKYSTAWTGDNQSLWSHLRMAIPQQCNLGLSGMSFVGTDIGGFGADTTPELLIRWVQLGCFSPLFRNHCAKGSIPQEPWCFGEETLNIYRKYVELRYQLLPYFYDLCRECEQTGLPVIRPLVLHYEHDKMVKNMNDQFLVGENLLVAPVLEQGAVKRMVYLPEGNWFDYWTHKRYVGPRHFVVNAPLDTCPIFVKAGTILPKAPLQMYVGEMEDAPLILEIYPGSGSYRHYRDNGEDFAYQNGKYIEYLFEKAGTRPITITKLHKGYPEYSEIIEEYIKPSI